MKIISRSKVQLAIKFITALTPFIIAITGLLNAVEHTDVYFCLYFGL